MIAGELARHRHQLFFREGKLHGLAAAGIDPRPDDMAMLAHPPAPVLLHVEDHGAGLAGETELRFGALDIVEILVAGQPSLQLVGIDRKAAQILPASGERVGLRLPFGECAVQVARDGASHLRHLDILIVLRVHEMGGEVLAAGAL